MKSQTLSSEFNKVGEKRKSERLSEKNLSLSHTKPTAASQKPSKRLLFDRDETVDSAYSLKKIVPLSPPTSASSATKKTTVSNQAETEGNHGAEENEEKKKEDFRKSERLSMESNRISPAPHSPA